MIWMDLSVLQIWHAACGSGQDDAVLKTRTSSRVRKIESNRERDRWLRSDTGDMSSEDVGTRGERRLSFLDSTDLSLWFPQKHSRIEPGSSGLGGAVRGTISYCLSRWSMQIRDKA